MNQATKLRYVLWREIDDNVIDRLGPNGVSKSIWNISKIFRKMHTGKIFHYAFVMLLGLVVILTWQTFLNI